MAVLYPQLQFFDGNGNPLADGLVYTYISNTNTPKSTWTTAGESANHQNPVELDSQGRAAIWLSTDSEYRIKVYTAGGIATGSQVGPTLDNITGVGIQLSSFSELASDIDVNGYSIISSSNGDINFTPNGSGDVKINTTTGTVDITNTTGGVNVTSTTGAVTVTSTTGDIKFNPTSSGAVVIGNGANGPGRARILEDTDNGANYIEVIAPASISSNKVQTLQDVTGTIIVTNGTDLPVADGGTGASTATAGFNALSPVTTRGDLIYRDATNNSRLALGSANRVLASDGTDPGYRGGLIHIRNLAFSGSSNADITNLPTAAGVTGYRIIFIGGPTTDGDEVSITLGTGAGPSYGSSNYSGVAIVSDGTTVSTSTGITTRFRLANGVNNAGVRIVGTIDITMTGSSSSVHADLYYQDSAAGAARSATYNGVWTDSSTLTGIRFTTNGGGNIDISGALYGYVI